MYFSTITRGHTAAKLELIEYDLLIIGGGITGTGIALDATTRGMKTALVEMQDFAAGTSSRSTKLVHGGLRYLKQMEVGMVAEVGKERAIVYENGPHVTTPERMLLPFYEGGTYGKRTTSIGLRVYDFLAGVKKNERRTMLTVEETLAKEPLVKQTDLNGGGYYVEYRTDDARLTIEVAKKAAEMGANLLNYCKVIDFMYENGKVTGALVEDRLLNRTYQVKAKKIINAAGPWVDTLREKDGSKQGKTLHLTKGSHIVIDQSRFPLKQAVYFDTPDGRMVFAIPRDNKAYVGTTDTFYDQDPVAPRVTKEDRTYLLQAITYMFPDVDVTDHDIESSWAGVRPLIHEDGKAPSEISRKDEIWISDSGLITIAGGKLTGYRKMAQQVVDVVAKQFETDFYIKFDTCQTKRLPISGGDVGGSQGFAAFVEQQTKIGMQAGLHENASRKIATLYGANAEKVYEQIRDHEYEAETYQLPLDVYAMLLYAIKQENVATPVDFLARRTGLILFNMEAAKQWAEGIISCMNEIFVWDDLQKARYTKELYEEIEAAENPL